MNIFYPSLTFGLLLLHSSFALSHAEITGREVLNVRPERSGGLVSLSDRHSPHRSRKRQTREIQKDPNISNRVEHLVETAIDIGELPGAVVLAGSHDSVFYKKAFGNRAVVPQVENMTTDTIFDLASLTKVVATTTSVMILLEKGQLSLRDRVSSYIPNFNRYGKSQITNGHLLTHMSGLRPDVDLTDPWAGYDTAIELASREVPMSPPGTKFIYSDINFFLLGEIVSKASGLTLDQFTQKHIFHPLGMTNTGFSLPSSMVQRIAPTEPCQRHDPVCNESSLQMLRGIVHDPTARRMGGVAGHAGLFSTASDLAVFCQMLLNGGTRNGIQILSPLSVARMSSPATPSYEPNVRGLGWDIDSVFSANRGELFSAGSFGHTGFTGSSLWLDRTTGTFLVFLSSRLHPNGKGNVIKLRARVATVIAATLPKKIVAETWDKGLFQPKIWTPESLQNNTRVNTLGGVDVIREDGFQILQNKRIGLLTNQSGSSKDAISTIDLLWEAKEVQLVALFSPEHGIRGQLNGPVPSSKDQDTGLTIHSLYGDTRRPTAEMHSGIDTIVVDLQDIGARFYTYVSSVAYVLEAAKTLGVEVMVLDRPNPINGFSIEGPMLDISALGFTGYFPMPIRHGLTIGELSKLINAETNINADLKIINMENWRRELWFDQTGLPWVNPSPNIRNLTQAILYPGIGALEGSNLSVGRGTDTPFEQIGAPWIDAVALSKTLNERILPGVSFYPIGFTPKSDKYVGEHCNGISIIVTDRNKLKPVRIAIEIASVLYRLYGDTYELDSTEKLLGSQDTITRIRAGEDPEKIVSTWEIDEIKWRQLRTRYLLYH